MSNPAREDTGATDEPPPYPPGFGPAVGGLNHRQAAVLALSAENDRLRTLGQINSDRLHLLTSFRIDYIPEAAPIPSPHCRCSCEHPVPDEGDQTIPLQILRAENARLRASVAAQDRRLDILSATHQPLLEGARLRHQIDEGLRSRMTSMDLDSSAQRNP